MLYTLSNSKISAKQNNRKTKEQNFEKMETGEQKEYGKNKMEFGGEMDFIGSSKLLSEICPTLLQCFKSNISTIDSFPQGAKHQTNK